MLRLPCRKTVTNIVEDFAAYLKMPLDAPLGEFFNPNYQSLEENYTCLDNARFIRDIFDVSCQSQLLYAQERPVFEVYKEKVLAKISQRGRSTR